MRVIVVTVAAASCAVMLAGCGGSGARQIDTGGRDVITTIDQVDIQNYIEAADELVQSMIRSGVLGRIAPEDGTPVIIELDRVRNDTFDDSIDVEIITDTVRIETLQSGLATFITPDSALARADRAAAEELEQDLPQAAYTLSGRITSVGAQAGRTRQNTFIFRLTLSSRDGLDVWSDQRRITKQGTRNAVGIG